MIEETKDLFEGIFADVSPPHNGAALRCRNREESPSSDIDLDVSPCTSGGGQKKQTEFVKYGKITFDTTAILHHYPQKSPENSSRLENNCKTSNGKTKVDTEKSGLCVQIREVQSENNNDIKSENKETKVVLADNVKNNNEAASSGKCGATSVNTITVLSNPIKFTEEKLKHEPWNIKRCKNSYASGSRSVVINVTQITRIVECNINWPGHEPCAAVSFGVPLNYAEDQDYRLTTDELEYMWLSYSSIDPYAARLRRMGISEFAIPNEGTVIMAWLVIFLGVFISALMLGFAIWRWNCFEGYSRMPLYNDTDSIISDKRKDDLYPTPHQNLPPLYSEGHYEDRWTNNADYKSTSKVDLSGYSNKNFMGDNELVYMDSDDDVIMSLPGQRDSSRDDG
ncbi:hypothetical protein EVAR_101881_1 [Eumeta japonica]|uniref:Uncharacterized protein n=1 Tax=Eumeta variegata TaxID=151549 RepID=A0A4C1SQR3_EUMVA|nr:hypothetical protein EVAR_101881_1 [Eumeta japonica]